jgi:hypothetical protein
MIPRRSTTCRRLAAAIVLALIMLLPAASAIAQSGHVRVVVAFNDGVAGAKMDSVVRSAVRQLKDVELVSKQDAPDYILTGTFMCAPQNRCDKAYAYTGALRLSAPLAATPLRVAAFNSGVMVSDSVSQRIVRQLTRYESTYQTWTLTFTTQEYARRMRDLVKSIDATCFEKQRIVAAIAGLPPAEWEKANTEQLSARKWQC